MKLHEITPIQLAILQILNAAYPSFVSEKDLVMEMKTRFPNEPEIDLLTKKEMIPSSTYLRAIVRYVIVKEKKTPKGVTFCAQINSRGSDYLASLISQKREKRHILSENKYEVFIAYCRDTAETNAKHLKKGLTKQRFNAFLDLDDIPKIVKSNTDEWRICRDKALMNSMKMVLIMTEGFETRPEVLHEIKLAMDNNIEIIYMKLERLPFNIEIKINDFLIDLSKYQLNEFNYKDELLGKVLSILKTNESITYKPSPVKIDTKDLLRMIYNDLINELIKPDEKNKPNGFIIRIIGGRNIKWDFGWLNAHPNSLVGMIKPNIVAWQREPRTLHINKRRIAIEIVIDSSFDYNELMLKLSNDRSSGYFKRVHVIIPSKWKKYSNMFKNKLFGVWLWEATYQWKCNNCGHIIDVTKIIQPLCPKCGKGDLKFRTPKFSFSEA